MKNPKLITKPFAQNGQKNAIPENYSSSMESNQATWDTGFGQITMIPVAAGGMPPKGQDFNGIFNQISENVVYLSKGGRFKFSADYAAAINGYPKGAILQSDDEKKEYQSVIDNNKVNFNTATQSQINAAWKLFSTDDMLQQLAGKQPAGDYATNTALNNGLGLKFDKTGGSLTGYLSAQKEVSSNFDGSLLSLITSDKTRGPHIAARRDASSAVTRHNMPEKNGTLAQIGDGGIVSTESYKDANAIEVTTFAASDGDSTNFFALFQPAISVKRPGGATGTGFVLQIQGDGTTEIAFRQRSNDVWRGWYKFLTEANTTKDANGFVRTGTATALITSQVAQSTGSSTANVMSQKAVTDAIAAVKTLGDGQKWTDVTSGRQSGVNYTNSTGRTIALFVCTPSANASSSIVITVDNVVCSRFGVGGNSNDFSRQSSGHAIIPAGSTYRVIAAGGIDVWSELR
ncbi:hypothetical protein [Providencia stuartii]|uniref:hypothetical protein n=1 Tax=Providencia stuartii TaxID=588 RepID=UPI001122F184|nr:hypothetical protein [Providencia stuartii]